MDQREKALQFLELHRSDPILVLPNAWDAGSARIFAASGAAAVGTTSAGVAAAAGFPDVEVIGLERMLQAVREIASAVDVPVNADMERGYGSTPDDVAASMDRAIDAGAVGVNVEDGTGDPSSPLVETSIHVERIAAIRASADARGIPLVINARTDVFLRKVGDERDRFAEAVARGNAYREAGADCVFVPGGLSRETISALVRELDAPLNVVANPAFSVPVVPAVPELEDLGVARVSVGSGILHAVYSFTRRIAGELVGEGSYATMKGEIERPGATEAYEIATGAR